MIWIANAVVLGFLLCILFFRYLERSSLQLVCTTNRDSPGCACGASRSNPRRMPSVKE